MARIFVDTVAWIALINSRDSLNAKAKSVFQGLRDQNYSFVTTEFILLEFANALSAPAFRQKASLFIDGLRRSEDVEIIGASSALFSLGIELYRERLDKEWSLVDCISFVVMNRQDISEAFTEDHHFEQAGFVSLL